MDKRGDGGHGFAEGDDDLWEGEGGDGLQVGKGEIGDGEAGAGARWGDVRLRRRGELGWWCCVCGLHRRVKVPKRGVDWGRETEAVGLEYA